MTEQLVRKGTHYSVAHAFMGVSYACEDASPSGTGVPPAILRLKDDAAKTAFLLDSLKSGDRLFLELGGAGDKLALMAHYMGVEVHRIPTFKIGDKDAAKQMALSKGWDVVDEPSMGEETADKLTARKARAMAVLAAAQDRPGDFLKIDDADERMLTIKMKYRSYRASQRTLLAAYQRLLANYNDQYLLELARNRKDLGDAVSGMFAGKNVHTQAALRAINALLVTIPEEAREQFLTRLGIDKIKGKKMIPRKTVASMFRKIIDALVESEEVAPFLASMKETKKEIEKLLKADRIHNKVFGPLPGCGPLIAARMMSAIVDIRNFRSRPALTAFAGYHCLPDGTRARRRAGAVSNWNMELKQAVYLWCTQTLKMPQSPWRTKLDQRRAYELYKLLKTRQAKAEAEGLDYEILPAEFVGRSINNTYDLTLADLAALIARVDMLRKKAGVKAKKDEDEDEESGVEDATLEEETEVAKDPALAKLTRGVKMQALQKAMRWLGQQMLKYVFKAWRDALGMPETTYVPRREPAPAVPPKQVTIGESYEITPLAPADAE